MSDRPGKQASSEQDYRSLGSGELADALELKEFFEGLGPVMRLPPKDEAPSRPASVAGGMSRRTILMVAGALALVALATVGPLALQAIQGSEPMPPGLVGTWQTSMPRYADRSFELSPTTLRLGLGAGTETYPISMVSSRDSSTSPIYTIDYLNGDTPLEFALTVHADSVAAIRNVPGVAWRKVVR